MKITFTLEDVKIDGEKEGISAQVKIDPPPQPDSPETPASILGTKIWKLIQAAHEAMKHPPSKVLDVTGRPIKTPRG